MQSPTGNVIGSQPLFTAQTWRPRVLCPACRSAATEVYCTKPIEDGDAARVRYHRCRICAALFKSVEAILERTSA